MVGVNICAFECPSTWKRDFGSGVRRVIDVRNREPNNNNSNSSKLAKFGVFVIESQRFVGFLVRLWLEIRIKMFRSRSWFGWNKPKNRLSLDHLKYLHVVLERNTTVSEHNRGLLVESLRCIAEILIWGDQNDSSVFDFFLEKNMLSYFLHIMRQKSGGSSFVCVQLLQTLNILFENIRNETSLYYLLSNNHVNSIIVHKFDFSDEDVMGYYILFLKTLSLKLNVHTIHFFYNEHTNDFPLYTEAIKFFNHPESMVRIAVRTISLNVYRVENPNMLEFIRDK